MEERKNLTGSEAPYRCSRRLLRGIYPNDLNRLFLCPVEQFKCKVESLFKCKVESLFIINVQGTVDTLYEDNPLISDK